MRLNCARSTDETSMRSKLTYLQIESLERELIATGTTLFVIGYVLRNSFRNFCHRNHELDWLALDNRVTLGRNHSRQSKSSPS